MPDVFSMVFDSSALKDALFARLGKAACEGERKSPV